MEGRSRSLTTGTAQNALLQDAKRTAQHPALAARTPANILAHLDDAIANSLAGLMSIRA
jgi:hypothetical protein